MSFSKSTMAIYRCNAILTLFGSFVVVAVSALALGLLFLAVTARDFWVLLVVAVFGIWIILVFRGLLSRSSIAIDDRQIAAHLFGLRTKALEWSNIEKIRKERVTNGYNYVDSFYVVDGKARSLICRYLVNLCGDIVFTQDISHLQGLLQQINSYARQYEIPLVVWDTEAAVAKLGGKKGTAYWRQAVAKIEEVRVTEF